MKKLAILIGILSVILASCATTAGARGDIEGTYRALVDEQKYLSAYNYLDGLEVQGEEQEALVFSLKVQTLINYFVSSMNHQEFGLKDLEDGEDIMALRKEGGDFVQVSYDIPTEGKILLEKYPDNILIYTTLGNFFYDLHLRYANDWPEYGDLNQMIIYYFTKAEALGADPYKFASALGEAYLGMGTYDKALEQLQMAQEAKPENPQMNYNLAYDLLALKRFAEALPYAEFAAEHYEDPKRNDDAHMLLGDIRMNLGNYEEAYNIYHDLYGRLSTEPFVVLRVVETGLASGGLDRAKEAAIQYANLTHSEPNAYSRLITVFSKQSKVDDYLKLDTLLQSTYAEDKEFLGILAFFRADLMLQMGRSDDVLLAVEDAEQNFTGVYPEDHPVFGALDKMREAAQR